MENVAVDYFEELFTTTSPTDFDDFLTEVTPYHSSDESTIVESSNGE